MPIHDEKHSDVNLRSPHTVVCATRGGPASYPTQDAAIAQAKARGQDIVFVYVTNLQFLDKVSSAVLVDMDEQMQELGEFLLLMAKERAQRAGVNAYTEVRSGSIYHALIELMRQYDANLVVLGKPGIADNHFQMKQLQELDERLRKETGVDVMLL